MKLRKNCGGPLFPAERQKQESGRDQNTDRGESFTKRQTINQNRRIDLLWQKKSNTEQRQERLLRLV